MSILNLFIQPINTGTIPYPNDNSDNKDTLSLYVGTNLATRVMTVIESQGLVGFFRSLDPAYYAWLRHRMARARQARDAGRLDPVAYEELRTRFNKIHTWAIGRFGEEQLLAAVRTLDPGSYKPPMAGLPDGGTRSVPEQQQPETTENGPDHPVEPFLFPKASEFPFTVKVPWLVVAQVAAIRDQALSLGWSEARLFQNRGRFSFPYGPDYGLVCFLQQNERLGRITGQHIEIIGQPPQESCLHFNNLDVDQPWVKRIPARS